MAHIFNFVFLFYVANYVLCPLFTPSPCLWLLPVDKGGHKARFLPTCFFSMIFVLPTNELSFFTSVLAFIKVIFAKSKSISWDQRQPGFYLRIWTLFFFFSKKSIIQRRWYIVKRFGVLILVEGRKVSDLFRAGDRRELLGAWVRSITITGLMRCGEMNRNFRRFCTHCNTMPTCLFNIITVYCSFTYRTNQTRVFFFHKLGGDECHGGINLIGEVP